MTRLNGLNRLNHLDLDAVQISGMRAQVVVAGSNGSQDADADTDADADLEGVLQGHGGGDYVLMKAFIDAVAAGDPTPILSGPDATLESHLAVFAAESARNADQVAKLLT